MTILLVSQSLGKNKKALEEALNTAPTSVYFQDPSSFAGSRGHFSGAAIPVGDSFACVMDHPKRMRFSEIKRTATGFKVR